MLACWAGHHHHHRINIAITTDLSLRRWDGQALRPVWGAECGENFPESVSPANPKVGCFGKRSGATNQYITS